MLLLISRLGDLIEGDSGVRLTLDEKVVVEIFTVIAPQPDKCIYQNWGIEKCWVLTIIDL